MGAVEQYLAVHTFGNPAVLQLLAHILQFKEELLVRETQQIAWCLVAIPTSHLQESSEDIYLFIIRKHIYTRHYIAAGGLCTLQFTLFHMVIGCHLGNKLIHTRWVLVGQGILRQFS